MQKLLRAVQGHKRGCQTQQQHHNRRHGPNNRFPVNEGFLGRRGQDQISLLAAAWALSGLASHFGRVLDRNPAVAAGAFEILGSVHNWRILTRDGVRQLHELPGKTGLNKSTLKLLTL
jgi:hypothetical protein